MTMGCSFLRVELLDLWPDVSSIAQDKTSLTSLVMLPSPSDFGGVDLQGLDIMMVETSPRGSTFWSGSSTVGGGMSICRWTGSPAVRLMLLASGSGKEVIMGSSCPFKPMG